MEIGMSGHSTWRGARDGRAEVFLKLSGEKGMLPLSDEAERLRWLAGRLPAPRLLHFETDDHREALLMSAVPGVDATRVIEGKPRETARVLGEALRLWHETPAADCPFDERLDVELELARRHVELGKVDVEDFDDCRLGRSADEVFAELLQTRPIQDGEFLTHGDYCVPNIMIDPDTMKATGFVDIGRAGIGSIYRDVALALRSLGYNGAGDCQQDFLAAYGLTEVNEELVEYYQLLDEFF